MDMKLLNVGVQYSKGFVHEECGPGYRGERGRSEIWRRQGRLRWGGQDGEGGERH
jgi:hypothetical protein